MKSNHFSQKERSIRFEEERRFYVIPFHEKFLFFTGRALILPWDIVSFAVNGAPGKMGIPVFTEPCRHTGPGIEHFHKGSLSDGESRCTLIVTCNTDQKKGGDKNFRTVEADNEKA